MTGNQTIPLRWRDHLAAGAIHCIVRACSLTWRMRQDNPESVLKTIAEGPAIFSLWHNRLAVAMPAYQYVVQRDHPARKVAALISASRDGAILASVMEKCGAQTVRGSSSRRGGQAMVELSRLAKRGYDIAITPDGPRGPRYQVQPGVISLAHLSGHPIIPCSGVIHWHKELKSWDQFQVPLPFTRCDIHFGEPLKIPRNASERERKAACTELEKRMRALAGN